MPKKQVDIVKIIDKLADKKRNRVAVGVLHDYPLSVKSLRSAKKYMDLVVVGPKKVPGFDFIKSKDAHDLVNMAKEGQVDAVFRGNFDAVEMYDAIHDIYDFDGTVVGISPAIVKRINTIDDNLNGLRCFMPISPSNYKGVASKIEDVDANIKFFEEFGVKPRIGFLSAGKPFDVLEGLPEVDKTITEAEFLVNWYKEKGYEAQHCNHQLEYAVRDTDIIVFSNGIAGNQGVRAMMFFGDLVNLGAVSVNLPLVYAQTAEAWRDWTNCFRFLNGYLNR